MLMQEYHFNLLRNIDIILITLTALLSVIIIIYASIDERYMRKRYNKLTNIISDLQKLEFQGNDAIVSDCSILIKKTTPFELFHILKHQENIQPGKFSEQFTECLNNSGKISAPIEVNIETRNGLFQFSKRCNLLRITPAYCEFCLFAMERAATIATSGDGSSSALIIS